MALPWLFIGTAAAVNMGLYCSQVLPNLSSRRWYMQAVYSVT